MLSLLSMPTTSSPLSLSLSFSHITPVAWVASEGKFYHLTLSWIFIFLLIFIFFSLLSHEVVVQHDLFKLLCQSSALVYAGLFLSLTFDLNNVINLLLSRPPLILTRTSTTSRSRTWSRSRTTRTTTTKSNSPPTTTPSQYQPQDLQYQHFEEEMNVYYEILLGFCFKPSCLWDTLVPVYQHQS